jgi:hypothetical protein
VSAADARTEPVRCARTALEWIANDGASLRSADDVIRYYAPVSGRTSICGQVKLATAIGLAGNMDHCRRALDRALRQRDRTPVNMKGAFAWVLAVQFTLDSGMGRRQGNGTSVKPPRATAEELFRPARARR